MLGHVRLGGASICYEVTGQGPPLLLLSGLGADRWVWLPQVRELSSDFTVITVDNRGTGDSRGRLYPLTIDSMAADARAVLDAMDIDRADVAGMSMGGFVAQTLALRWPERIGRLVLACTSWRGFGQVWPRGDFYALTLRARRWRSPVRLGTFFSESFMAEHPDEMMWWYEAARDHTVPIQVVMAQLLAAAAFDVSGVLQDIQAPTLVVHGTEDRIIPVYNGHGLAARIRDARLILFKGAGHGMTIERSAEFNGAVASFLGGRLHELPGGALHPVDDSLAAGGASTSASARGTKVWH